MNIRKPLLRINLAAAFAVCALRFSSTISVAQPDPNWIDHDRSRPLPPVVTPGLPGTPDREIRTLAELPDLLVRS